MNKIIENDLIAYFSYGSNTNVQEFRERTGHDLPDPSVVAMLPDRELAFTNYAKGRNGGVLDVRPKVGSVVYGAVHWIPKALESVIGGKEGSRYVKRHGWVYTLDGRRIWVFFYEVRAEFREDFVPPADAYLRAVEKGYKDTDLSPTPLFAAAEGQPWCSPMRLIASGPLTRGGRLFSHIDFLRAGPSVPMEFFGESYDLHGTVMVKVRSRRRNLVAADAYHFQDTETSLARLDQLMGVQPHDSRKPGIYRTPLRAGTVERGRVYDAWCYVWWDRMPAGAMRLRGAAPITDLADSLAIGLVQ